MEKFRFLLSGSGGQGIITMAILLAEAAVLHQGLWAVQSQSYGPQARGGATRSDVIISNEPIHFPKVTQPNVLVTLTNEAAGKHLSLIRPGGILLFDSALVQPSRNIDARHKGLPFYQATLDIFGNGLVYNIVVLGALAFITKAVTVASLEKAVQHHFAPAFHTNNIEALHLGVKLAKTLPKE